MPGRPASADRAATSYQEAAAILAERDPVLRRLTADAGPASVSPPTESHLAALVRAIVYQQLAGAAAAAIHGRLIAALGGEVTAERLLSLPTETLRSVGLSGAKTASLQDLAAKVADGTVVLDPSRLRSESDADVVARLSTVRGIGRWTAEMFLMFQLHRLVAEAGPPHVRPPAETHFAALVRSVLYQQLAGPAAAAIHGRLIAALGGEITPERMLALPADTLRSVGLSGSKAASVADLAAKVLDGTVVLDRPGLRAESDAEVVARLTAVRGIGKWTAEMFLMFQLGRLDVWPTGDLGVRKGFGLAWEIPTPTAKQLEPLGDPYRPYRSVVAWYCWRAAELYGGTADSALTR